MRFLENVLPGNKKTGEALFFSPENIQKKSETERELTNSGGQKALVIIFCRGSRFQVQNRVPGTEPGAEPVPITEPGAEPVPITELLSLTETKDNNPFWASIELDTDLDTKPFFGFFSLFFARKPETYRPIQPSGLLSDP